MINLNYQIVKDNLHMTKTRSNEFISNLKIEYTDGSFYATYIRNSDGKELHSVIGKRFNGFDIESCKNMIKDLENLKIEQLRERIMNPDESSSQKFDRYISETKAIDQIIDNYTRIESTLSP